MQPGLLLAGAVLVGLLAVLPAVLEACSRWDVSFEDSSLARRDYAAEVLAADEDASGGLNASELQRFSKRLCAEAFSGARRRTVHGWDRRFDKLLTKRLEARQELDVTVLLEPGSEARAVLASALDYGLHEGPASCSWILADAYFHRLEASWQRGFDYWVADPIRSWPERMRWRLGCLCTVSVNGGPRECVPWWRWHWCIGEIGGGLAGS